MSSAELVFLRRAMGRCPFAAFCLVLSAIDTWRYAAGLSHVFGAGRECLFNNRTKSWPRSFMRSTHRGHGNSHGRSAETASFCAREYLGIRVA